VDEWMSLLVDEFIEFIGLLRTV